MYVANLFDFFYLSMWVHLWKMSLYLEKMLNIRLSGLVLIITPGLIQINQSKQVTVVPWDTILIPSIIKNRHIPNHVLMLKWMWMSFIHSKTPKFVFLIRKIVLCITAMYKIYSHDINRIFVIMYITYIAVVERVKTHRLPPLFVSPSMPFCIFVC